jgi:hypothetical protein
MISQRFEVSFTSFQPEIKQSVWCRDRWVTSNDEGRQTTCGTNQKGS